MGAMVEMKSIEQEEYERDHPKSFEEKYNEWHRRISFWKSGIRLASSIGTILLVGTGFLTYGIITLAAGFFLAEVLGVLEERMP